MDMPSLQYGVRYFMVHSDDEADQLRELQSQYSIAGRAEPFSRCLKCNLTLVEVEREAVVGRVPEKILASFEQFYICPECERVYWPGSHLQRNYTKASHRSSKEKIENYGLCSDWWTRPAGASLRGGFQKPRRRSWPPRREKQP